MVEDVLRRMREQKTGIYTTALNKHDPDMVKIKKASFINKIIFHIHLLLLSGFAVVIFFMMKGYASKVNKALEGLQNTEKTLNSRTENIETFTVDLKSTNNDLKSAALRIREAEQKIAQLEEINKAQVATIENLTKAKNNLFSHMNALQAEIERLKAAINNKRVD